MRRALFVVGAVAAAIGTGGVAQAGISDLEDERFKGGDPTRFEGECELEGRVIYPDEPLVNEQRELTVGVETFGTCEGSLDGEESRTFDVKSSGYKENETFGCATVGQELPARLDDLPGELNPEPSAGENNENNIALAMTTTNPNGITFEGRNGGELTGVFNVDDLGGFFERCAGEGNREVRFEATLVGEITG